MTARRSAAHALLACVIAASLCAGAVGQDDLAQRARAAEARGTWQEAADLFARLETEQPEELAWVLGRARCLRSATLFNDALDVLEAAQKRFPDDVDLPAMLAATYLAKAEHMVAGGDHSMNVTFQIEQGAHVASEALKRHPGHRQLRTCLAQAHYGLGRLDEARAEAEELIRRFPVHIAGYVLAGKIAFQEFVTARRALAERPRGKRLTELTEQAADARQRATEAYRQALLLDPELVAAHVQLGNIEMWLGNNDAALEHWKTALAIDAGANVNHSWIAGNFGTTQRTAFYEAAAAAYRERADADPARAATLDWWLAWAHYERRRYERAYALFDAAVTANPGFHNSYAYAMLAAYWKSNHDAAELQAERFAQRAPRQFADFIRNNNREELTGVLQFLARRSYDAGRLDRSRALHHVVAMVVDTAAHWNNYAFLCRETGKYQESYDAYLNALSLEPESPQLLNDAAVILHYHLASPENLRKARDLYYRAIDAAEKVLKADGTTADERERARTARTDARNNLRRLGDKLR